MLDRDSDVKLGLALSLSLSDKRKALAKPHLTSSPKTHCFPVSLSPVLAVVEAAFPRRFAPANGFSPRRSRSEFGSVSRARGGKERKLAMGVPLGSVSRAVVCIVLVVIGSAVLECDAQLLPQDEVDTLKTITTKLQNEYWNVSKTSCSGGIGLNVTLASGMISNVTCNCSFNDSTVCHVTNIQLRGLNLTGVFPDEFGNLPYLTEIDITRNYISGLLPTTLTRIPLTILSALGNRISGIPKEIGNISTLEELRISDLKGPSSNFPDLQGMRMLEALILRNCLLTGSIPGYIGEMTSLKTLDLSVNRLTGQVPDKMGAAVDYMFLTNNSLTGAVPSWGNQVLKDFNIAEEAGGVGKGIHKDFNNIYVNGSTLEIHLYWSGKGTTAIPEREATFTITILPCHRGYMAPEYAMRGYLTDKADVYSFGIVALEIVSGKSNTNYRPTEEFVYLLDWAYVLQEQGNVLELVDPHLGSDYSEEEAMRMLNLALLCTDPSPTLRPPMSSVVSMLEGKSAIQAPIIKRTATNSDPRFRALERPSSDSQTNISTFSRDTHQVPGSMSIKGPWIDSSASFTTLGNRICGIPKEIGSTLEELVLEDNLLEDALEPDIGNLSRLRRL
ncbi:hypothetical protein NL676_023995 [Syzygium grande]|nr:hypothetical protein NL676_023995 [Syzygium grande]